MWHGWRGVETELSKFLLTHPVWDVTVHNHLLRVWAFISTHTSRVGCDAFPYTHASPFCEFLLTHPVWDVTCLLLYNYLMHTTISTHTSRVGCDVNIICCISAPIRFLLTHPVWDVTYSHLDNGLLTEISTHTSRVGCDYVTVMCIYP